MAGRFCLREWAFKFVRRGPEKYSGSPGASIMRRSRTHELPRVLSSFYRQSPRKADNRLGGGHFAIPLQGAGGLAETGFLNRTTFAWAVLSRADVPFSFFDTKKRCLPESVGSVIHAG